MNEVLEKELWTSIRNALYMVARAIEKVFRIEVKEKMHCPVCGAQRDFIRK